MFNLFNIIPKRTKRKFFRPISHIFFLKKQTRASIKKNLKKKAIKKIQNQKKNTKYKNKTFKIQTKANK
jgi:hypothetical protein